jgi:hypothetical protein
VKLYLSPSTSPECVVQAIEHVLQQLDTHYIDLLVISVAQYQNLPTIWEVCLVKSNSKTNRNKRFIWTMKKWEWVRMRKREREGEWEWANESERERERMTYWRRWVVNDDKRCRNWRSYITLQKWNKSEYQNFRWKNSAIFFNMPK